MSAYYNEIDPYAAQWLRNLINAGHIAHGDVDERSISNVAPSDVAGYTQCHFFAGIGGWSLALRFAGCDDSRTVWTGSCPCQPFSIAGTGGGFTDERHLWPHWFHLIREIRPSIVFGEQVEAAINHGWFDLVQDDMEGEIYSFAAVVIPAAGIGAPHIRHRIWFVAESKLQHEPSARHESQRFRNVTRCGQTSVLADNNNQRLEGWSSTQQCTDQQPSRSNSVVSELGIPNSTRSQPRKQTTTPTGHRYTVDPTGWVDCEWVFCRDGKWRPIEPGTFPLAHGISNRVGRLRSYGNAINPQTGAEVIKAYMECRP